MIVVATPTGSVGREVLENIIDSGQPIRVSARDPSRLPPQTRERVEVVQGSHGDIEIVNQAFAGAEPGAGLCNSQAAWVATWGEREPPVVPIAFRLSPATQRDPA